MAVDRHAGSVTFFVTDFRHIERLKAALEGEAPFLVGPAGTIQLSPSVHQMLRRLLDLMASGQPVTLTRGDKFVTTQQAADILGMSRPKFIRLLETNVMAYHMVGNQRRVHLRDVQAYAHWRIRGGPPRLSFPPERPVVTWPTSHVPDEESSKGDSDPPTNP